MSELGRPRVIDGAMKQTIIALVSVGCSVRTAAARVGVTEGAIRANAKQDPEFLRNLKRALSECEGEHIENVRAAGKMSWQASAWFLERRWAKTWGRTEKLEHTGKAGGPIRVQHEQEIVRKLSEDPETAAALDLIAMRAARHGQPAKS